MFPACQGAAGLPVVEKPEPHLEGIFLWQPRQ